MLGLGQLQGFEYLLLVLSQYTPCTSPPHPYSPHGARFGTGFAGHHLEGVLFRCGSVVPRNFRKRLNPSQHLQSHCNSAWRTLRLQVYGNMNIFHWGLVSLIPK